MAEILVPNVQLGPLEITYRELLIELKTYVPQLFCQTDATVCFKWIQKLQTLTAPNDMKLRNYLLLQICNQIHSGYLNHPFINLSYLDKDLILVANCCREWEAMCNTTNDMRKVRSASNISELNSHNCVSDVDGSSDIIGFREQPDIHYPKPSATCGRIFYQQKYEESLIDLKKTKLEVCSKNTRSLEELVEHLAASFIEKYQNATDELLSIEKSRNKREEFAAFELNLCSKFKLICGDLLKPSVADNLLLSEEQFQRIFARILSNFVDGCNNRMTDRASVSTDLELNLMNSTKYSDYLKRYIRKQRKQFNRKTQLHENQIDALKKEICLRDKKQSMQIIEMKCENIIRNEQKVRDQLSESINDLEAKYKKIVQQIFDELQEHT